MNVKETLEKYQSWMNIADLAFCLKVSKQEVLQELLLLIENNEVKKQGEKKGLQYALSSIDIPFTRNKFVRTQILKYLEQTDVPVSRKDICIHVNSYNAIVKPILLEMIDEGLVFSNKRQKNQKFCLSSKENLVSQIQEEMLQSKNKIQRGGARKENREMVKEKIFNFMKENQLPVTRVQICKELKLYDNIVKTTLFKLIEEGKVIFNNKKKGQKFLLIENKENEHLLYDKNDSQKSDLQNCFENLEQMIIKAVDTMPLSEVMSINDLQNHIFEVGKHNFSHDEIFEHLNNMIKSQQLPHLKHDMKYTETGSRQIYWREIEENVSQSPSSASRD